MKHLKNIIWLSLISILLIQNLLAQTPDEGASLGVKAGVNISSYNLKDASAGSAPGFNLGLFSRAAFSKTFSIQPEFNLNIQNSKVTSNNESFNMWMSYLEFTVSGVAIYKKFYFQFGPYISYLLNSKINNESPAGADLSDMTDRNNFYDIDYGLVYTTGVQVTRWDISIRFNQGLFKMGKDKTPDGNLNIYRENKNSMLQLFAGYYF